MLAERRPMFSLMYLLVLVNLSNPPSLLGQHVTITNESLNMDAPCKTVRDFLKHNRVYYIDISPAEEAEVTVFTSVRQGDSIRTEASDATALPVLINIPLGPIRIDSLKFFLVKTKTNVRFGFTDPWQVGRLMHVTLTSRTFARVNYVPCPAPQAGGFLDKPIIKMPPTRKKFSILTASFGAISAGSFLWFLNEKSNADDQYQKYQDATTFQRAIELRKDVEKSRTRRDIAGWTSFASGAAFAFLLTRDLFFRKPPDHHTLLDPSSSSEKRFSINLESPASAPGITLAMNMKF